MHSRCPSKLKPNPHNQKRPYMGRIQSLKSHSKLHYEVQVRSGSSHRGLTERMPLVGHKPTLSILYQFLQSGHLHHKLKGL